jgi:DnaJ-class molecular chaperone
VERSVFDGELVRFVLRVHYGKVEAARASHSFQRVRRCSNDLDRGMWYRFQTAWLMKEAPRETAWKVAVTSRIKTPKLEEHVCAACEGTGFPEVKQPVEPGRKIYPPGCKACDGKGKIVGRQVRRVR